MIHRIHTLGVDALFNDDDFTIVIEEVEHHRDPNPWEAATVIDMIDLWTSPQGSTRESPDGRPWGIFTDHNGVIHCGYREPQQENGGEPQPARLQFSEEAPESKDSLDDVDALIREIEAALDDI